MNIIQNYLETYLDKIIVGVIIGEFIKIKPYIDFEPQSGNPERHVSIGKKSYNVDFNRRKIKFLS